MQALFRCGTYASGMAKRSPSDSKLRQLREAAGLSVRELARQIGENHTNVSYWERSGQIPRSDVLAPIASALGVSVQELLGEPAPQRPATPAGKLGRIIESLNKLPRRQQEKVVEMIETILAGHHAKQGKPQ